MLILTRKIGETITIGDRIKIVVVDIKGKQVRLGVEAPQETTIYREEIIKRSRRRTDWRPNWIFPSWINYDGLIISVLIEGAKALQIETRRFGTIAVEEEQIFHLPEGIIGFPEWTRYILLNHREGSPFLWFQSVENRDLAFVLLDPLDLVADYDVDLSPEDSLLLQLDQPVAELKTLVVVNISKQQPPEITANLLAPVVINSGKKIAKQVILYQTAYSVRHPVSTKN